MSALDVRNRIRANRKGILSEWLVAGFLILKGYRIVAMRYRTKLGEIDLVARKGDLVAMIEVKARNTIEQAVDAVNPTTMRRIQNASDLWLAKQPDAKKLSIRYDIVAVQPWRLPIHLKDAF